MDVKYFKMFEIRWAEPVGLPECPYLYRWVLTLFGYSLRLHHWIGSDDHRHFHDHPWDFWVWIIGGWGYTETICHPDDDTVEVVVRQVGDVTFYKAEHRHKVGLYPATDNSSLDNWSLVFSKRSRRKHGFWIEGRDKIMRPLRYFSRFGHHPCEGDIK